NIGAGRMRFKPGLGKPGKIAERSLFRDNRANVAVEFAMFAPILAYAFLAATDVGLSFWQKGKVANAARAGAEYAVAHGWDNSAITSAATSATNLSVSVTPTTYCGCAGSAGISQQTC